MREQINPTSSTTSSGLRGAQRVNGLTITISEEVIGRFLLHW